MGTAKHSWLPVARKLARLPIIMPGASFPPGMLLFEGKMYKTVKLKSKPVEGFLEEIESLSPEAFAWLMEQAQTAAFYLNFNNNWSSSKISAKLKAYEIGCVVKDSIQHLSPDGFISYKDTKDISQVIVEWNENEFNENKFITFDDEMLAKAKQGIYTWDLTTPPLPKD